MTLRKLLRALVILLLLVAVTVGLTSVKHPIILKWLSGSARLISKPTKAVVYTNGQMNNDVKVFHVDKHWNSEPADYYLLHFPNAGSSRLKVLCLNRKDNYAGGPSSINIRDYDIVAGLLFQSEAGSRFTPMQNGIKGFDFDPHLIFIDRQIMLKIPPTEKALNCDSLRVVL